MLPFQVEQHLLSREWNTSEPRSAYFLASSSMPASRCMSATCYDLLRQCYGKLYHSERLSNDCYMPGFSPFNYSRTSLFPLLLKACLLINKCWGLSATRARRRLLAQNGATLVFVGLCWAHTEFTIVYFVRSHGSHTAVTQNFRERPLQDRGAASNAPTQQAT